LRRNKRKPKARSKTRSRIRSRPKSKKTRKQKRAKVSSSKLRISAKSALKPISRLKIELAPVITPIGQIAQIAATSSIARYPWKKRGQAYIGYIKGMALVYARVYCKLKAGDSAVAVMSKANSGDNALDALSWYDEEFLAAGMNNNAPGADTLRHLFVLLVGLGMRESSGRYCEGRDRHASNTKADTAEAGLFQTSFDARTGSPELPTLFARYSANPSGFVETFKEGVICKPADWENYGTGPGANFQRLSKTCPAFAAEFAAVGLRTIRTHWGPINRKEAEVRADCDAMLMEVQKLMDANPNFCSTVLATQQVPSV
jgi:hypothetical protein